MKDQAISAICQLLHVFGWTMVVVGILSNIRNAMVFRFRMKLLDRIEPGTPDFRQLMDEFYSVSYKSMCLKFWKPMASFWPADSRLRAAGVIK